MNRKEAERVGETLTFVRQARQVTQFELARALNISQPYLANIEAGRRQLTPKLARKACEVLAIRPIVLVNRDFFAEEVG